MANQNNMNDSADEKRAIFEIQKWLRFISKFNEEIIPLNPDGIFGEETEAAVKAFQKMFNIPETGVVDINTWNLIRDTHNDLKEVKSPPDPIFAFPVEMHSFKMGDDFDEVLLLQIILDKIAKRYENIPPSSLSGIYDEETMQQVLKLQEIFNLEKTGKVDKKTWNKISKLYSSLSYND